ncbi:hypothetical protein QVD17_42394 [Tagetes erecta]|uniref:Uncharacterized protein n=1 Tax=Tagetes erecta TaxID=13708 RepID=A0AAD8NFD4_TARER|nr:hypothetical protein QVD17_42394 [Tagetes erecta]
MERRIDVLIGSVGTDGARTRNVRLDRAVLLPIELQSQGNKKRSIRHFGFFLFSRIRVLRWIQDPLLSSGFKPKWSFFFFFLFDMDEYNN